MTETNSISVHDDLFQDDLTNQDGFRIMESSNSLADQQAKPNDVWSNSSDNLSVYDESPYKRKALVAITPDSLGNSPPLGAKSMKSESLEEKKKPGRKPGQTEPASKRKAQNRAAQRAFRDRKERHLKDLETRVAELEDETTATHSENEFLRFQLEHLQQELNAYRSKARIENSVNSRATIPTGFSAPFSFEFPYFSKETKKENAFEGTLRSSTSLASGPLPVLSSPWEANTESSLSFNTSQYSPSLKASTTESSSNPRSPASSFIDVLPSSAVPMEPVEQREFCAKLSMACGTRSNPVPQQTAGPEGVVVSPPTGSTMDLLAGIIPPTNPKMSQIPITMTSSFANLTPIGVNNHININPMGLNASAPVNGIPLVNNLNNTATTGTIDNFFVGYRDPIFESEDITIPELANNNNNSNNNNNNNNNNTYQYNPVTELILQQQLPPPQGLVVNQQPMIHPNMGHNNIIMPGFQDKPPTRPELIPATGFPVYNLPMTLPVDDNEPIVPDGSHDLINCSAVWDRITAHPKFDEIDIEGLCTELRTKAKCSEAGVVLNGCDVDNILYKL